MVSVPDEQLSVPYLEPGRYQHYKGRHHYEVIGVGLDTETLESLVIYSTVYKSKVTLWARPYDMFVGTVVIDGIKTPRFKKLN